jgi:multidrug efflux system membrane fusion protein
LIDAGNVVTAAGQAPGTNLLSIQTLDPIYADFTITEAELLKVQQYMSQGTLAVQVQLPQDAIAINATPPATQPATQPTADLSIPRLGQLTFLDNAVQDGSGTIKLRATIPNSDHHFWPGQFVNVRLVLKVQKNAVLVPTQSVQISQKGPFVFVVKPDGTADPRPVTQGQRQGDLVVIEQGIDAGEQVVVTGQQLVMPGGKVMVTNAPPHGPAGAPGAGGPPAAQADSKQHNGSQS